MAWRMVVFLMPISFSRSLVLLAPSLRLRRTFVRTFERVKVLSDSSARSYLSDADIFHLSISGDLFSFL
ncbi:MAG: hypothetical protein A4E51_01673 [Methanosaeta sp. PtaU1.Bin055]|nr:MAG: hypothetical protein A4E51_01673 [Methanosaeta sp. PtaU1.Bin055]